MGARHQILARLTVACLAAVCVAGPVAAAPPKLQPPMNAFDFAFYVCEGRGSFQITYDSEAPKTATMTTSDNNKAYVLTRKAVANGVEFADGAVRFWTDGRKVVVEGTATPMQDCKRQAN
jgi:membrane-bound inhibitor of C-type lysozyme